MELVKDLKRSAGIIIVDLKAQFRHEIKNKICSYSQDTLKKKSQAMISLLHKLLTPFSGLWAAYRPMKSEPQIEFDSVFPQIQWAYPVTDHSQLQFKKQVSGWKKSALGVSEPTDGEIAQLTSFEGFLIPCLGLSTQGHRLGRGAGFYDRTFSDKNLTNNFKIGLKIGLCFSDAFLADVPSESHDLLLDVGVTEQGIYFFNNTIKNIFNGVGE